MTMPSISPLPITLVSPVTMRAPASSHASRIDALDALRGRARGNPSSMMTAQVSAEHLGRAHHRQIVHRAATPPAGRCRRRGRTPGESTCESVVMTSHRSPTRIAAPSSIAARPISPARRVGAKPSRNDLLDQRAHGAAAGAVLQRDALIGSTDSAIVRPPEVRMSAVLMPDPARAFAAHHARADRRVGHALAAEQRAVGRRLDAGHDVAADALLRRAPTARSPTAMRGRCRSGGARRGARTRRAGAGCRWARARCRASGRRSGVNTRQSCSCASQVARRASRSAETCSRPRRARRAPARPA